MADPDCGDLGDFVRMDWDARWDSAFRQHAENVRLRIFMEGRGVTPDMMAAQSPAYLAAMREYEVSRL